MEKTKIFGNIANIISEVAAVGKDKTNLNQKYKFRGIDDVMNAIHPLLAKHKVFIVPEVLEQKREERVTNKGSNIIYSILKVRYRFYAEDGSYIEAITLGEGMDSGDKASNKAMAVAFKYALFQTFCIPTEEMQDPDSTTPPETVPRQFTQNKKPKRINEEAVKNLEMELKRTHISIVGIKKEYKVNNLGEMNVEQYTECMMRLKDKPNGKILLNNLEELQNELRRTGEAPDAICENYKINKLSDMEYLQYLDCMKRLKQKPTLQ